VAARHSLVQSIRETVEGNNCPVWGDGGCKETSLSHQGSFWGATLKGVSGEGGNAFVSTVISQMVVVCL